MPDPARLNPFKRDEVETAIERWREAGLISEPTADAVRLFERARRSAGPAAGAASRVADAGAVLGVALVVAAALVLAFGQFEQDFGARIAVLATAGAVVLVAAGAARRLRLAATSDALAGAAVLLLTVCVVAGLEELGDPGDEGLGWALTCIAGVLLGGAVSWWTRSRSAAVLAVLAWVALPAALLVSEGSGRDPFEGPFDYEASTGLAWAALALMVVAAALAAVGAQFAARRGALGGRVDRATAVWIAFVASAVLTVALVVVAIGQDERGFYAAVAVGAAVATGIAVWRREWVWLPSAAGLYFAACGFALGGLSEPEGQALGVAVLVMSFFTFAPLARRLPSHWMTRVWEMVVWLMALWVASWFAFESAGWPAVGGVWAAAMIAAAAMQRRWLALAVGALGLYVTFLAVVIGAFDASLGAGLGTLLFGVLVLAAAIAWRRRVGRRAHA